MGLDPVLVQAGALLFPPGPLLSPGRVLPQHPLHARLAAMLERSREVFLRLWRIATNIKTFSEWFSIAGWLGVPGISAAIALYYGLTFDIVFLYLLGGIAFWYVVKEQLRTDLTARLAPQVKAVFEHPSCHDCACSVDPVNPEFRVRLGVLNVSTATLRNVEVFLVSLTPGFKGKRGLRWVGEQFGAAISLKPSNDHHHVELLSWDFDTSDGNECCYLGIAEPRRLKEQAYDAVLSIEADDIRPMLVELKIDTRSRPGVTISSR